MRRTLVCLLGLMAVSCEPVAANPKFGAIKKPKPKPAAVVVDYSASTVRGTVPGEEAAAWMKGAVVFDRSHALIIGHANAEPGFTLYVKVKGVRHYRTIVETEKVVVSSISTANRQGDLTLCRVDAAWPEEVKPAVFPAKAIAGTALTGATMERGTTPRVALALAARAQTYPGWDDVKNPAWCLLTGGDGSAKAPHYFAGSSGCCVWTKKGELALLVSRGSGVFPKDRAKYGDYAGRGYSGGQGADLSNKLVQAAVRREFED